MNTRKIITSIAVFMLPALLFAQDASKPAAKEVVSENNQLAILLAITAIVLAFVIWGMGKVLIEVSRLALDKSNASKVLGVIVLIVLSCSAQSTQAQDATKEVVKTVANYGGLSESTFQAFTIVIGAEILVILFLTFFIRRIYAELQPEKKKAIVQENKLAAWWVGLDKKIFTRAVPVAKEADVMLDHNYDGIRELDNALPPWWKYGFYITIVIAFVYLLNFHVLGNGKNPTQEYQAEMENAQRDKEIYDAKNKDRIDENNVPMADAAGLARAKEIFTTECWSCHGKLGEGGAGPNLTDDYWLHKGSLNDIYQSITHGYPDKGMQAWSVKFNPKEISQLASFIKTLHGTNPPGAKAPQGDMYTEVIKIASDSTKTIKDSTNAIKKDSLLKAKK